MGPFGFIVLIIVVLMLVDIKWKQDKMLKKMDTNNDLLKEILTAISHKPIE